MRRFLYTNGLSIALVIISLIMLTGHALAGFFEFNNEQAEHAEQGLSFLPYLCSSHFWESVAENWESEFLQMGAFVLMTQFLRQKGSAESRKLKEEEAEEKKREKQIEDKAAKAGKTPWPVTKGGIIAWLYAESLWIAFGVLFIISFVIHALSSYREYADEQSSHGRVQEPLSSYLLSSRLWFESLQNWQSEFLAILAMVVLSIFLRAKDSPESKPVGAAHSDTGH